MSPHENVKKKEEKTMLVGNMGKILLYEIKI